MSKTERLPEQECVYFRALSGAERNARAAALVRTGWSLAALGEAFTPPKTRSTIKSWITSSSSSSSLSTLRTAEKSLPVPGSAAGSSHDPPRLRRDRRVYDRRSPVMTSDERKKIKDLAPVARQFRARANPNGVFARANRELTVVCIDLHSRGASVRELSSAAGVTYRAMARRLGR